MISLKKLEEVHHYYDRLKEIDEALSHIRNLAESLLDQDKVTISFEAPEKENILQPHTHGEMQIQSFSLADMFLKSMGGQDNCDCPACQRRRSQSKSSVKASDYVLNIDNKVAMTIIQTIVGSMQVERLEIVAHIEGLGFKE